MCGGSLCDVIVDSLRNEMAHWETCWLSPRCFGSLLKMWCYLVAH